MAKALDPRQLALQALSQAVVDPAPRLLHGTAKARRFFTGTAQPAKLAAQYCQDHRWLEPTGQFEGKGKTRKELFRITAAGIKEVLANSEPVKLLGDAATYLVQNNDHLEEIKARIESTLAALRQQKEVVDALRERLQPPDLERLLAGATAERPGPSPASGEWLDAALKYLREHRKSNPYAHCPLPELFHRVAEPRSVSIGQFHDGLRQLVAEGRTRLHAFTGAAYTLQEDQLALVAGQEIKYYAESIAGS